MVEGLSKKITGDWVDIGQAGLNITSLVDYFSLTTHSVATIADGLSSSTDQGIVEYKEHLTRPIFSLLDDVKFKSISFDALNAEKSSIDCVLFLTLIQRLFATKKVAVSQGEDGRISEIPRESIPDIKFILADVMARVKENPEYKQKTAVKMILTQLVIYQKERDTMEKLAPNITEPQKKAAFRENFQKTFRKITDSIQKYYGELLIEQQNETRDKREESKFSLSQLELKTLVPFFTRQSKEIARIRSIISFAIEGRYKVREILVRVHGEEKSVLSLYEQELSMYRKMGNTLAVPATAETISNSFALEIVRRLHSVIDSSV
ncbi:MAG: hypothetical protein JW904_09095 [Spirochaetales bacterium]|nr:hypothetical protein [Spirochaetales bacterium]